MSIIKTHDVILYGSVGEYNIILRPLCDDHLPLLYKWNADPEVLYWSEGFDAGINDEADVENIYSKASRCGHCFLVEVNGISIGECLLCDVMVESVFEKYPPNTDIRRIDTLIGEKEYWGCGIGSAFVRMLMDFAFCNEQVDILYCFANDYNERSIKTFTKYGFEIVALEAGEVHLVLTRQKYTRR